MITDLARFAPRHSPPISTVRLGALIVSNALAAPASSTHLLEWLALSLTPGLGPTRARKLVEHFGSPEAVFRAELTALEATGIQAVSAQSLATGKSGELASEEMAAGIEPDDCFYIQHQAEMVGKDRIDLTVDPPPDLVLEIDVTSTTALQAYEALPAEKEAVLAYHFLRTAGQPLTAAELDRRIEDWFTGRWDATFDFEVDDGVGKLRRMRLVDNDGQGRLTAVTLDEAKRRLDQTWDSLFVYDEPQRRAEV